MGDLKMKKINLKKFMLKEVEGEGIIVGKSGGGIKLKLLDDLGDRDLGDRMIYVPSDSGEDFWTNNNAKEAILFEIFKRFENRTNFPDRKFTSGPEELKKIVSEVVEENAYLNQDDTTREYFLSCITEIFDDIALKKNNATAQKFLAKYADYVSEQLTRIDLDKSRCRVL